MSLVTETRGAQAIVKPTLYKLIRENIERRILTGEWPPGHRIPFEHELTARYRCSRMTVSKALCELVQAGLIERHRRAGSFVRRPQILSAVLAIADIRAEISALGRSYGYELLTFKRRAAKKADMARLSVTRAGDVLAITCRHRADGAAFAIEDRLINLDAVPKAATADFAVEPPGTWLLAHVPWTEANHTIGAVPADPATAEALEIGAGAACLVIDRQTWRGARTLTAVRLTYPGEAHRLVARFKAGGA